MKSEPRSSSGAGAIGLSIPDSPLCGAILDPLEYRRSAGRLLDANAPAAKREVLNFEFRAVEPEVKFVADGETPSRPRHLEMRDCTVARQSWIVRSEQRRRAATSADVRNGEVRSLVVVEATASFSYLRRVSSDGKNLEKSGGEPRRVSRRARGRQPA
jgi:hypothetical protein